VEAGKASFAFVILTPDDVIQKPELVYAQGRPNTIFELGWFYGKLGRDKACILKKDGTNINTDIHGVSRIQFNNKIDDFNIIQQIKNELRKAKIIE
jgi:predicted nucleotide-binding protein